MMNRLTLITITLLAWALGPAVSEAKDNSTKAGRATPEIRVTKDNWRGASLRDIRKVLESAAKELTVHAGRDDWPPIIVSRSKTSPIVLFKRGKQGEYLVKLNTQGNFWCQYSFQFSHEIGHILCGYKDGSNANLWLEESLCETASLFSMRRMSKSWVKTPPYQNWKDYAPHLGKYAQERIDKNGLPKNVSVAEWYAKNREVLRKNPTDRAKNTTIATKLLPLFEEKPKRWATVAYLNKCKVGKPRSFSRHLADWKKSCPEPDQRAFVDELADLFGVKLP